MYDADSVLKGRQGTDVVWIGTLLWLGVGPWGDLPQRQPPCPDHTAIVTSEGLSLSDSEVVDYGPPVLRLFSV